MNIQQNVPLLFVDDIVASKAFYCAGLGFDVAETWEPNGKIAWCRLRQGGADLMLQQACDEDPPAYERGKGVGFFLFCEDVDTVYQEITKRGIKATPPVEAFYGMKQTFVTDPDGYELCFQHRTNGS